MRKSILVSLAAVAALSMTACSQKAANETSEAADAVAADANATMSSAASDVHNATDAAFGSAETHMDRAADAMGNAADKAKTKTGAALRDMGNEIDE
jgi:hypothetical protein